MNKYKKAIYDIGKILFEGEEDDVWEDYEVATACELICRKLCSLGLVELDYQEDGWRASDKLIKYMNEKEK